MTHASLFSGIGGFDLAAEWMGWENIFHCEWNPFGQRVLAHHFPNSKSYNDITKTDFSLHAGQIDILTGGFPCQPYSQAGKRLGKADERHLFPHMLRCIKEVKPKWVIGENVRGLVSWGGGVVFNEVCDDLEREGYEVQPFLIPAAGINAPHQRQRIWFVAHCNNEKRFRENYNNGEWSVEKQEPHNRNELRNNIGSVGECEDVTNSISIRLEHSEEGRNIYQSTGKTQSERSKSSESFETNGFNGNVTNSTSNGGKQDNRIRKSRFFNQTSKTNEWENFPTQSPICGGDDGLPKELDNITFSKWRNESIKAYGNAIVPQVAYEIFKAIQSFEDMVNV